MNEIFKFSRFINYSKVQLVQGRKLFLLLFSGSFIVLFFFTLLLLANNKYWNLGDWNVLFLMSGAIGALLIVGHAFPFLRNKEARQNTLMIPVSTFEKFTYEFVFKIILFTLLYPILFQLMASTVLPLVEFIYPEKTFLPFLFDLKFNDEHILPTVILGYLFAVSLAFAGASVIKRFPLAKTIVFVGIIILIGIGYLYILLEKLQLNTGLRYLGKHTIPDENAAFTWLYLFLTISSISAWAYAYYKLKEREVE